MRLELDAIVPAPPVPTDADTQGHADSADFAEARSSLNQGIKAAQAGNRSQARASLLRATELNPRDENAWLWLASISEYPEELLGFLNHVLAINPKNERAVEWTAQTHSLLSRTFVQRGIDAANEGQKELAGECFQTALEHDDRNAVAWMWLASLSDTSADKITLLQRAVSIDPANEAASAALNDARANILKDRLTEAKTAAVAGNNARAIEILDDLINVDPSSVDAWTMRSHLAEGFDEKIRCFESILAIDPDNVAAKAGRDSLLTIFGTAQEAASNKHDEPASDPYFVEDAFVSQVPDHGIEEPSSPIRPEETFQASKEYAEPPTQPGVEENEDEQHYTFEEPPDSLATQTEAPLEVANENEHLGLEESPEFAFAPPADVLEAEIAEHPVNPVEFSPTPDELSEKEGTAQYADDIAFTPEPEVYAAVVEDAQAETVAFSYSELSGDWSTESSPELSGDWSSESSDEPEPTLRSDAEIPMPVVDLPQAPSAPHEAAPVTFVEPKNTVHTNTDSVVCAFCSNENEPQAISCGRCLAVLTLSDLEMLLANQRADKLLIRQAVEEMERYRLARPFTAQELVFLGIGHLNLKNLQLGYTCLSEASRMTPNDVVLSGQVNSLLIRLDEIRQQEEAHLRMPKGKSILVVDDSPTVRKLISGKLEKCGHDVICANDGVEAMERLEHFVPDLVLLDINMPRMDGYQVCKLIRSNDATKDVAVVMISGKDGFFDKVRGRMAGTTGYITKPFGPETLMKAVEMYLSGEVPEPDEE